MSFQAATQDDFAFLIPREKFVYKEKGEWKLDCLVGKDGIRHYLKMRGWEDDLITSCLKAQNYMVVADVIMQPNKPPLFMDTQKNVFINTWVAPTIKPVQGEYPSIQALLEKITSGDEEGIKWLKHWIALKVQNPEIVPKVAVVLSTTPGLGKGTLFYVISRMLGSENCAIIGREALESRFNSRWAQKLFILADEVLCSDNVRDVSDRLKMLIDAPTIELEGKGKDQRQVKNRAAWLFASNDKISPVNVERGDRRYTVFNNHDILEPGYIEMLNGLFEADRETPTNTFLAEIEAFYYEMQNLQVDRGFVARPYANESRENLIEANTHAHDLFFKEVDEYGIDDWLEKVITQGQDFSLSRTRSQWDFKDQGLATEIVYQCYIEFCKSRGVRGHLKYNRFGAAIRGHRPVWVPKRNSVGDKRVNCYVVKRNIKDKGLKVVQNG